MQKKNRSNQKSLTIINQHAAGVDIGSTFHVVAIAEHLDEQPVRKFQTFTDDLLQLAYWLKQKDITTVAMESTGVYWIPLFEILESHGIQAILVNAREVKNVPGRKTDIKDAQWLQQLHQYGLLHASFRPREHITILRSYMRQRSTLVEYAASHIQHMQKALQQMNVQLHHVVSDITGATGMRIIRAIVEGEHDPVTLSSYRDMRCKSSEETIAAALKGNYRPEHLFALQQAVSLYDFYQTKITECDRKIEQTVAELSAQAETPSKPLPPARHRTKQTNEPDFAVRSALYALLGVDLTQIIGIGPSMALNLISECGDTMEKWPTEKHFTSWLSLCPSNKIS